MVFSLKNIPDLHYKTAFEFLIKQQALSIFIYHLRWPYRNYSLYLVVELISDENL